MASTQVITPPAPEIHVPTLSDRTETILHPDGQAVTISVHGNQTVRERVLMADSASAQGCSFNTSLNPKDLLDRTILLRVPIDVVMTASADNDAIDLTTGANLTLASDPIHRIMQSCTLTVNNCSQSYEPYITSAALNKYNAHHEGNFSLTVADPFNTVSRLNVAQPPFVKTGTDVSRQDYPYTLTQTVAAGPSTKNVIKRSYILTCVLDHPFLARAGAEEALANVSGLQLAISWTQSLNGVALKLAELKTAGTAAVNVTAEFPAGQKPSLLLRTYQPSVAIPKTVTVPSNQFITKRFTVAALDATVKPFETGNITLSQVPERIFIFARPATAIADAVTPDIFANISGLTVRSSNNSGGLSGATGEQLFEMSKRNKSEQSFDQWNDAQGSVLCIDVAEDVGGWTPGVRETMSLDMQVSLSACTWDDHPYKVLTTARTTGAAANYNLYVVFEMAGKLSLAEGGQAMVSGGTEVAKVVQALSGGFVHKWHLKAPSRRMRGGGSKLGGGTKLGGGFFQDFGRGFTRGFTMPLQAAGALAPVAGFIGGPQAAAGAAAAGASGNFLSGLIK